MNNLREGRRQQQKQQQQEQGGPRSKALDDQDQSSTPTDVRDINLWACCRNAVISLQEKNRKKQQKTKMTKKNNPNKKCLLVFVEFYLHFPVKIAPTNEKKFIKIKAILDTKIRYF